MCVCVWGGGGGGGGGGGYRLGCMLPLLDTTRRAGSR